MRGIRGKLGRASALLLSAVIVLSFGQATAGPVTNTPADVTIANFEIDGNTSDQPAKPGDDWDTVSHVSFNDNDPADPECGADDDIFNNGSKEFEPGDWVFGCGSVPQKDDILNAGILLREFQGDQWAFFRFTRKGNNGDAFANAEFNQSGAVFDNDNDPSTPSVPMRTADDLLLALFVRNGGQSLSLDVMRWVGDHISGTWVSTINDADPPVFGTDWAASTDANPRGRWTFAEAGINIARLGLEPSCPGLGKVWIKTTASAVFDSAALKDRTIRKDANLSNCATKHWEFSFSPQPIQGAKVFAMYTVTDETDPRVLELSGPDASGLYTATDNQVPPGSVTFHFEVKNADGDLIWQSPEDTETLAEKGEATNTGSLAYQIEMTPESADNLTPPEGSPPSSHVFTATVTEVGTGVPLTNLDVNFELTDATPADCGSFSATEDLDATTNDTDSLGQATATMYSSDACTVSIRAWIDGTDGTAGQFDSSADPSDVSTKRFIEYALSVAPPTATNEAPSDHAFTVTLTRDDGSGPVGVAGETVNLELQQDAGMDGEIISINGVAQPAGTTSGACTTRDDDPDPAELGTCEVVIHADQLGAVTLHATYQAQAGDDQQTINSSGDKHFVSAAIAIAPQEKVNEVNDSDTFTITVTAYPDDAPGNVTFDSITTSVIPAGASVDDDCDTPTSDTDVNGNPTATCTLTINSTSSAVFTINATAQVSIGDLTITRSTESSPGPGGSGPATKRFVDAAITISPDGVVTNKTGQEHVFTITATAFPAGTGDPTFSITTSVTPAPDGVNTTVEDTCDTPTLGSDTDGNPTATCTLTIDSSVPGSFTINATAAVTMGGVTVTRSTDGNSGPGGSGPATKRFLQFSITKTCCPEDVVAPGGTLTYTIDWSVTANDGEPIADVAVTDDLPNEFLFQSATPAPDTVPAPGTAGPALSWTFGTLNDPASGTIKITGSIDPATPLGTQVRNAATLHAEGLSEESAPCSVTVSIGNAGHDERAFGVRVDALEGTGLVLGDPDIDPTPDSDVTNPDDVASVSDPVSGDVLRANLLTVQESGSTDPNGSTSSAIATTADVCVQDSDPGPGESCLVKATAVRAVSSSNADISTAGSSSAGSVLENVTVAGQNLDTVTEPTTIVVKDPVLNTTTTVALLEETRGGAAAGVPMPDEADGHNRSSLAVNAIHVRVLENDPGDAIPGTAVLDVIVAHADSSASFLSGEVCIRGPHVSGSGFALGITADESALDPDTLLDVEVGSVFLPSTGGEDDATLKHVGPISVSGTQTVVESNTAFAHTEGTVDSAANTGSASTYAQIEDLKLLDTDAGPAESFLLTAGLVRAESTSSASGSPTSDPPTAASTGKTVLANVDVAGVGDVCDLLFGPLPAALDQCEPAPNTVLLGIPDAVIVLNEQTPGPSGPGVTELTVNAIHIYVLGQNNPFGLPANAQIIVASAHSDAASGDGEVAGTPEPAPGPTIISLPLSGGGGGSASDSQASRPAAPAAPAAPADVPSSGGKEPQAPPALPGTEALEDLGLAG